MEREEQMSAKSFEIDGEKLRAEFKKRNLTLAQVERECGFGQSTVSNYCSKNYVTNVVREMLALRYNIQFDTYKKVEDEAPQVEVVPQHIFTEEDWERLYKVIYSATYEAMKIALSGE